MVYIWLHTSSSFHLHYHLLPRASLSSSRTLSPTENPVSLAIHWTFFPSLCRHIAYFALVYELLLFSDYESNVLSYSVAGKSYITASCILTIFANLTSFILFFSYIIVRRSTQLFHRYVSKTYSLSSCCIHSPLHLNTVTNNYFSLSSTTTHPPNRHSIQQYHQPSNQPPPPPFPPVHP